MVLSRSFAVNVPANDNLQAAPDSMLTLLPVGDLLNHDAQSLSRTRYNPDTDSVTIATKKAFQAGDEVVSTYAFMHTLQHLHGILLTVPVFVLVFTPRLSTTGTIR